MTDSWSALLDLEVRDTLTLAMFTGHSGSDLAISHEVANLRKINNARASAAAHALLYACILHVEVDVTLQACFTWSSSGLICTGAGLHRFNRRLFGVDCHGANWSLTSRIIVLMMNSVGRWSWQLTQKGWTFPCWQHYFFSECFAPAVVRIPHHNIIL